MSLILLSAFTAGILNSLSPCVFVTLPFVVNSALREGKKGPLFLSLGLIISFVLIGVVFSSATSLFFVSKEQVKIFSASFLLIVSLFFIFPFLSQKLADYSSSFSSKINNFLNSLKLNGLRGQLVIGLFLGAIWSPCSGPTLGFALSLITIQNEILSGALIMLVFGIAATIPLILVAYFSSDLVKKRSNKVNNLHSKVKVIMGVLIMLYALMVLTGLEKYFESIILNSTPEAILDLITKY
jgi:cytochrome c-type biogenesis protein